MSCAWEDVQLGDGPLPLAYPSAADAELQRLMGVYRSQGWLAAQRAATDSLVGNLIGAGDYLWLCAWTEGRR